MKPDIQTVYNVLLGTVFLLGVLWLIVLSIGRAVYDLERKIQKIEQERRP